MSSSEENAPMSGADPSLAREVGEKLLTEVKMVARSITDRVLRTLREGTERGPAMDDPTRPLRVLCVDDYPDAADTLAEVVRMFGCEVRVCYDGPSAITVAEEFLPDVCFLDLVMPGMSGLELGARLREAARARPLLLAATTALGSVQDQTATAVAGFHAHLVKPVDAPTLRATLNRFRETARATPPNPTA
jgi:CheY-like chemotaxis protein